MAPGQPFISVAVGTPSGVSFYVDNALAAVHPTPAWPLSLNGTIADGQFAPVGQTALTVGEAIVYRRTALRAGERGGAGSDARLRAVCRGYDPLLVENSYAMP